MVGDAVRFFRQNALSALKFGDGLDLLLLNRRESTRHLGLIFELGKWQAQWCGGSFGNLVMVYRWVLVRCPLTS